MHVEPLPVLVSAVSAQAANQVGASAGEEEHPNGGHQGERRETGARVVADPECRQAEHPERQKSGSHQRVLVRANLEHLLHRTVEEAGERDRQRQRGGVALGLDGVDRLPRDTQRFPQLSLRKRPLAAESPDCVFHRGVKLA